MQWVIGIDEAGRGPLAGPVAVGMAMVSADFDWSSLPGVTDSKNLSEAKREAVYRAAKLLEKDGALVTAVTLVSAAEIDKRGIVSAIKKGIAKNLATAAKTPPRSFLGGVLPRKDLGDVQVLLDGGLKAPAEWTNQETIIRGDATEKVIGLASIMAKVTRDRYMRRAAQLPAYAAYDFSKHKGYGTKAHREAIAVHGLSPEHRVSYCKNIKML